MGKATLKERSKFRQFRIPLVIFILFVLFQALPIWQGWVGASCIHSLSGPSKGDHPEFSWTGFGEPLEFFRITREGCFEDRTTHFEFFPLPLAINVSAFVGLALAIYGIRFLLRFTKHKDDAAHGK
jgi:hypothetical protein